MSPIRIPSQFFFGLLIIAVGVVFTLDNLDVLYADDYLHYWPILLIAYGLTRFLDPRCNKWWAAIWTVLGALLLLDNLEMIRFRLHDWWPMILVVVGSSMLWGALRRKASGGTAILRASEGTDTDTVIELTAIMGGIERKNDSQDFRGGKITAIMGGCEFDLRSADIKQGEAVIEVFALWGGIELRVPQQWAVSMEGMPLMGGLADSTHRPAGATGKRLIIRGTALMGGVEVKN